MHYLPGLSGVSMEKPFVDCMRDVWSLFDGAAMLSLHFGTLFAAVERLRKSASARVHETKNGNVLFLRIYGFKINYN